MYSFRRLKRADKALFDDWLNQPHIGGWWENSDREWDLVEEDWASDPNPTDMRIVEKDGVPFAYIQDYNAHAFGAPHYASLPKNTQALDMFLGDPNFLGQGHAKGYLRQRADELIANGAELVVVDPDTRNTRAIATYRAAGFVGDRVETFPDGVSVLILTYPIAA